MDARLRYPMINVSWLENYFKFQWRWNWGPTWERSILQLINGRTWIDYRHFRQRIGAISSCSVNIHFIILWIDDNSTFFFNHVYYRYTFDWFSWHTYANGLKRFSSLDNVQLRHVTRKHVWKLPKHLIKLEKLFTKLTEWFWWNAFFLLS